MRIVLYGLNFAPEPTGIGKYTGEMAQWLAGRGHEVRVISAPPYYPFWKVQPGYRGMRYTHEQVGGAEVWRSPLWVPSSPSGSTRLIHLASFAASSTPLLAMNIAWKPDVVFVIAPALFCAAGGLSLARATGALACLHIQDFEVDAAFDLGLIKNRGLASAARGVERSLMRQFDWVSTISGKMIDSLREKGVDADKTVEFPNWVDCRKIHPLNRPSPYRKQLGIAKDTVVAMYSGAFGEKQGIEILIQAAQRLAQLERLLFVVAGAGPAFDRFKARARHLTNLRCLPLQPEVRLNDWLNLADIHLIPQKRDVADLVMPSKLTGILASGRPIIATARAGTQLAEIAEKAGLVSEPEDIPAFIEAIRRLADDKPLRKKLGAAGRAIAEADFDQDAVLGRLEARLSEALAVKRELRSSPVSTAMAMASGLIARFK